MKAETYSTAHGATWRLEFVSPDIGVRWTQLANFTARISDVYRRGDGEMMYRISGLQAGRGGRAFSFDIPVRSFHHRRPFMRAISGSAGAGSCVWVGRAAAFRRSIIAGSGAAIREAGQVLR